MVFRESAEEAWDMVTALRGMYHKTVPSMSEGMAELEMGRVALIDPECEEIARARAEYLRIHPKGW